MSPPTFRLHVNGQPFDLAVDGAAPLLAVLRNDLGLNGPKYGCGLGECGACAVLVDGVAARACAMPLAGVAGREVTTLEGLARPALQAAGASALQPAPSSELHGRLQAGLHPVQQAFIDTQAAQCGYCLNGMVMSTVALLRRQPRPTEAQARAALSHNLCRCGTHLEILAAVQRAVVLMALEVSSGPACP